MRIAKQYASNLDIYLFPIRTSWKLAPLKKRFGESFLGARGECFSTSRADCKAIRVESCHLDHTKKQDTKWYSVFLCIVELDKIRTSRKLAPSRKRFGESFLGARGECFSTSRADCEAIRVESCHLDHNHQHSFIQRKSLF